MASAAEAGPQARDRGDLLCLILDLNSAQWQKSAEQSADALSLEQALDHVLVFCNAHLSLQHENELVVVGAGPGESRLLFSSPLLPLIEAPVDAAESEDVTSYQKFRLVKTQVVKGVQELMTGTSSADAASNTNLVAAMSTALCHIHRLASSDALANKPSPRLLVLSVSEDANDQYVSMMNCIFFAQKSSIPIDVCRIFGKEAVFLQQACHLSNGIYYCPARRKALLQYLMTCFLAGTHTRRAFQIPVDEEVDLRAACFCHRRIIDQGYVCSVCLSIFCTPRPSCLTCKNKY